MSLPPATFLSRSELRPLDALARQFAMISMGQIHPGQRRLVGGIAARGNLANWNTFSNNTSPFGRRCRSNTSIKAALIGPGAYGVEGEVETGFKILEKVPCRRSAQTVSLKLEPTKLPATWRHPLGARKLSKGAYNARRRPHLDDLASVWPSLPLKNDDDAARPPA